MGRNVIHEFVAEYAPEDGGIDLQRLRTAMAELMERGARAVQLDGYEQDDAVLDRFVIARPIGDSRTLTVAVEALTDIGRLLDPVRQEAARRGWPHVSDSTIEIVGLVVQVVADPDAPIGGSFGR